MNFRREFEIPFVGLKPGIHEYEYRVDDKFFAHYDREDFKNCTATVKVELDKKNGFMLLRFDVDGSYETNCDRCGNPLTLQLWEEFKLMIKLVDDPESMNDTEEDPDVFYIGKGESHLHLADWIYEFVTLSVPMQKMCKETEMGGSQCNKEVLEKLARMQEEAEKENNNPLWKGLEKFKNID